MTVRRIVLAVALLALGCAARAPITSVAELRGEWKGRVASPVGQGPAAMAVAENGDFKGVMFLDGGDRSFHGALVVVRPGQVRYQGTHGNGSVRVVEEHGRRVLKFLRDDGGVDATFRQF